MAMQTADAARTETTDLARFVLDTYKDWANNRRQLFEERWQANRDAFRGLDAEAWRDPDADGRSGGEDAGTDRTSTDWHSTTTIRLTKQKVMTAYALVIDSILQGGRVPFMLKPSGEQHINAEDMPPEAAEALAADINDMAQRINVQFDRCNADRQLGRAVLSGAIYGRCWAKFAAREHSRRAMVQVPMPVMDEAGAQVGVAAGWDVRTERMLDPAVEFVSIWDVFHDVEAEDARRSAGIIHRRYVSPRDLRAMAGTGGGWRGRAIQQALREAKREAPAQGDSSEAMLPRLRDVPHRRNTVRVLEAWIMVPRKVADGFEADEAAQGETVSPLDEARTAGDEVPCLVGLAGDQVVRFLRLPEGEPWPWYSVPWEEDIDEPKAFGVADNLSQTQGVLNAAIRCFEDNKRFAASLILGLKRRMINNPRWDGRIKPQMILEVAEDARTIADAVSAFVVPDVGRSLLDLIQMFVQFADEESMIPKIMQGARDTNNQTAYEASVRAEKGGKYMGAVIRNFDEYLIAPVVQDFYEWNMLDPAVESGKGAYDVVALGFTSFQDRVIRLGAIQQFLSIVLGDPELRRLVRLDDALREICKALDLDPDQWLKTLKQIEEEAAEPDIAAVLGVKLQEAQIAKAEAEAAKTLAEAEAVGERLKIDRAKAVADISAGNRQATEKRTGAA